MTLPPRAYATPRAAPGGGGAAIREFRRVIVSADRIAAVAPFDGVDVHAIKRGKLRFLDFFPTRGFALGVAADDGIVYLANGYDGVRIGRIGSGGTIEWLAHVQTHDARGVAREGSSLFIADGEGGLKIADVGDPARARLVGAHTSPHYLSAVVVRGDRAYCAAGFGGVEIVDVSNPRRPRLVWRRDFSEVRGVDADERYLYVADAFEGFHIFSLDGPEPRHVSSLDTPGWNADVTVRGDAAYLADGGRGIVVADIADRGRPRILSSAPTGSVARQVRLEGATLFVAAYTRGILAFDVSDPARPAEVAQFQTVNDARGVCAADPFICVASGAGGLYVFAYTR